MICIYDPLDTAFTGHGLAMLRPISCTVREQAGGAYELTIEMPVTDDGRWELLVRGAVIRAPVPQVVTPVLTLRQPDSTEGVGVYSVTFADHTLASARSLYIRAEPDPFGAVLDRAPEGTELIHTGEVSDDGVWMQFVTPTGACGWAAKYYVVYVRPYVAEDATGGVIEARQVRDQLFRIHNVDQSEDGTSVTAMARHITYDRMYNAAQELVLDAPTPAAAACEQMEAALEDQEQAFRVLAGVEGTVTGSWKCVNGVNALLDPKTGLAALLRARVVRDNFDIFLLPNVEDTGGGISIRYGKNLTGVSVNVEDDGVYTRFVPLGKDKAGATLRLPEGCIDSARIADYTFPRILMWEVAGAQIGSKQTQQDGSSKTLTEEDVYTLMREAVQAQLDRGADEPVVKVSVSFVELGQTREYAALAQLQKVFLYDWVTVVHGPRKLRLRRQVCGYEFDCLQGRYLQLELGDVFADRTAGVI